MLRQGLWGGVVQQDSCVFVATLRFLLSVQTHSPQISLSMIEISSRMNILGLFLINGAFLASIEYLVTMATLPHP